MRAPLTKLARPSGALAMVAVDQREALRGMFAAHQSTPVPDSQLTQFKQTSPKSIQVKHHAFKLRVRLLAGWLAGPQAS